MNKDLRAYLDAHPHHFETTETWPVQGKLRVRLCLGSTLPPADVSSSILAIVFDAHRRVLFIDPDHPCGTIVHLLIGGRPEAGEPPQETVIREVGEETGWRIEPGRQIGFRHFFHLQPFVPGSDRPYPDFIQPIFAARAVAFDPSLILPADHLPTTFLDYPTAERLTAPAQRPLLHAAAEDLFPSFPS